MFATIRNMYCIIHCKIIIICLINWRKKLITDGDYTFLCFQKNKKVSKIYEKS